jgi:hypothetical protein
VLETYEGGCHCGRVRFRVRGDLAAASVCNCSICTKKGIVHLVVVSEQFTVLSGESELTNYQFGSHVAKHTFCRHCGMHPFYVPRSYPDRISVNVRCLDDIDADTLRPTGHFDGRNWEAAMRDRQAAESKQ